jgi:hypothetical protein
VITEVLRAHADVQVVAVADAGEQALNALGCFESAQPEKAANYGATAAWSAWSRRYIVQAGPGRLLLSVVVLT